MSSTRPAKVFAALVQFPITRSIPQNLAWIDAALERTQPGDLALFPEGAVSGYEPDAAFLDQIDLAALEAALDHLAAAAQRRQVMLWAGACVRRAGQWVNAAFGFSPGGERLVYEKINLANLERGLFHAGDRLPVFDWSAPGGVVRIGVQMCRELRYPEQWGWLARGGDDAVGPAGTVSAAGAQVLLHLNNAVGDRLIQPVWRSHLVSRAAETQRYVLSVNQAAADQKCPTLAVGPQGQVLGEILSPQFGVLRVELDLTSVSNTNLEQCRSDVVSLRRVVR